MAGLSVHIPLNLDAGQASPQFHAKFDNDFDTTQSDLAVSQAPNFMLAGVHILQGDG